MSVDGLSLRWTGREKEQNKEGLTLEGKRSLDGWVRSSYRPCPEATNALKGESCVDCDNRGSDMLAPDRLVSAPGGLEFPKQGVQGYTGRAEGGLESYPVGRLQGTACPGPTRSNDSSLPADRGKGSTGPQGCPRFQPPSSSHRSQGPREPTTLKLKLWASPIRHQITCPLAYRRRGRAHGGLIITASNTPGFGP